MNKTYIAMAMENPNLNVGTIYFTDAFLNGDVVNPVTQAKYTAEEKTALAAADLTAPKGGVIAISAVDSRNVLWFDTDAAEKIVAHADALVIRGKEITTVDGQRVASAL